MQLIDVRGHLTLTLDRQEKQAVTGIQRTMTVLIEEGIKKGNTMTGALTANKRSPFAQRGHIRSDDEQEGVELPRMSGDLG
jgi:hypothetical protein